MKPTRNDPCPCGSGRKYKRCCGAQERPAKQAMPSPAPSAAAMPQMPFDPSQLDPQMMAQMTQALQRLPRAQMQKLQGLMQKAMAGKDVTREAAELERMLPPQFKKMLEGFVPPEALSAGAPTMETNLPSAAPASSAPNSDEEMSEEQARAIIEAAAAEGRISEDQAKELLGTQTPTSTNKKFGRLWRSLTGAGSRNDSK